jgi:CRP/FNR family transcriptional regulator, dissimilatory nitrate respiration regulator
MLNTLTPYRRAAIEHILDCCPLFSGMPRDEFNAIVDVCVLKPLAKGEYLFAQGTSSHGFYVVQFGAVRLYRVNGTGREQIIHIARVGESFGEESLFSEKGYIVNASAAENTRVVFLGKAQIFQLLQTQRSLGVRLLQSISNQMRQVVGLLDDLRLKDARTRLLYWLLEHCPERGSHGPQEVSLSTSKNLLASELGMTSETLSRVLADFRQRRLLQVNRRIFRINSPVQLEQLATGQFASARSRASHKDLVPASEMHEVAC